MSKEKKNVNDILKKQLERERSKRSGAEVGLPESIRVVFGEEHNPEDG